ncbi:MAG: fimbrillin family protein, partial [Muribaculaceae bacterium]|nr:fimbrillin family protein [Muribaculaceae bacterium]
MKVYNSKYPYLYLLLPAMLMTGCADDPLYSVDPVGNPDAITFSANTVDAVVDGRTRGETPLYDPLVLTGDGDAATLYLHTFETNRIGFQPGDDTETLTRGNQVTSAADLLTFHKNFKVLANKKNDGSNYLGWTDAHIANSGDNVWYTSRTEYWPAAEQLSFYAVSPSTEFENLSELNASAGVISFDYEAKRGAAGAGKDAEAQQDLLLSAYECDKSSHGGQAPLQFSHALSAVKFAIRDVLGGEVVNIRIGGVKSAGHCVFEKNQDGDYQVAWTAQSGEETFSQDFNYAIDSDRNVSVSDDTKDEVLNAKMPEKTFMMIPQQISDEAYIEVTLKRSANVVAAGAKEEITVRGKIKDNLVEEWKPGYEYVYTISTSKDNWVYVFDVKGNEAEGYDNLYVYSPNDDRFKELENTAYYSVVSYRYRANAQNTVENLPWTASFEGSESYNEEELYEGKWIDAEKWITDKNETKFSGTGSMTAERHDIEMHPHYVTTDWEGDKTMQNHTPYSHYPQMTSKATPYDLSTFGSVDKSNRNTANCYVIDRGGWYSFPLVYGNAIKNGGLNEGSYKCTSTASAVLTNLKDYRNNNITGSAISGGSSATLVWEDAYNMIAEVGLVKIGGEDM